MATLPSSASKIQDISRAKDQEQNMARRLALGRFSPSKKSEKPGIDDPPTIAHQSIATRAYGELEGIETDEDDKLFENEEEGDDDEVENLDLSVVRSLLGASFKLDTEPSSRSVSFSGVDTPESAKGDHMKSQGELLSKIERLQIRLKQAELDLSAEKARRKKSSRSTIKLAKEINKRTIEGSANKLAIDKLTTANAVLEAKLTATRTELEQRIAASESSGRDNHRHLSEAQQKYRDAVDQNDRRITEMTTAHSQEVEGLRRQLAVANKDLEMLRGKLVKLEVQEAERIAEHTIYTGIDPTLAKKLTKKKKMRTAAIALGVIAFAWLYQLTAFSMDSICGPVKIGTKLGKGDRVYEAPWWAPTALKEQYFGICGDRKRVKLSWTMGAGEVGRLSVTTLDEKNPTTLLDRKALSAIVKDDRLDIIERKGKVESVKLPWM